MVAMKKGWSVVMKRVGTTDANALCHLGLKRNVSSPRASIPNRSTSINHGFCIDSTFVTESSPLHW